MQNTGNTTWGYYTFFLESQNPKGNTAFGPAQLNSCDQLAPGGFCTFSTTITAPSTTGTYVQRRMLHNGVNFGASTTDVVVTVTSH